MTSPYLTQPLRSEMEARAARLRADPRKWTAEVMDDDDGERGYFMILQGCTAVASGLSEADARFIADTCNKARGIK